MKKFPTKTLQNLCVFAVVIILSATTDFSNAQNISPFRNIQEIIVNTNGSQSWVGEYRHWHVTPEGDTIVSFLNEAQARDFRKQQEQINFIPQFNYQLPEDMAPRTKSSNEIIQQITDGTRDLIYDVTDPSFGLVPYRHGNDTIPLNDDIAIKNKANKIIQLEAEIATDQTDLINASTSGWNCDVYARQDATINKFGVYDIENSTLSSGSGNLPFDFSYNGQGEAPGYFVTTTTTDGGPHAICGAFIGTDNMEDNDATDFTQWYFWEPQTDARVYPGDYSISANHPIEIDWYGYTYSSPWNQWWYNSQNILKYNLNNGVATNTYTQPDLTQFWTPFDQVEYPSDQTHEFPGDTSVVANGEPDSLYTGTIYSHSDVSTQTNDSTCSDVTYTVTRTWEGIAGDYNSSNTLAAAHDQIINIEDTSPSTANFPGGITLEYYVGIENTLNSSLFGPPTNIQDNSNLPVDSTMTENSSQIMNGSCQQVNFVYSHEWDLDDVCSNNLSHSINAYVQDNTSPVRDNDGNWSDNSGLEVLVTTDTTSNQNPDPNTCEHYTYIQTVTETGEDVCSNEGSYSYPPENVENEAPYLVSTPVPNNDTIYVPEGHSIHPDSTGWAEWADPENGPIQRDYTDKKIEENEIHRLWYREQTGEDPCEISPEIAMHYIYEHKPTGIPENELEKIIKDNVSVSPNPSDGNFTIKYISNDTKAIETILYNFQGQKMKKHIFNDIHPGVNTFLYGLTNANPGIYFLETKKKVCVETEKIIIINKD